MNDGAQQNMEMFQCVVEVDEREKKGGMGQLGSINWHDGGK
jgi:hypothetical protein